MGQGNTTGLASMLAEELDADWALVRTEYAPSDPTRYNNLAFGPMQGTGGSSAIANSYLQYRGAGAAARAMLVPPRRSVEGARDRDAHVEERADARSGKRASYGEMAELPAAQARRASLRSSSPRSSSRSARTRRARASTRRRSATAARVYTIDVKLPGLLTAVIVLAAGFGAKLVSFDASEAKKVKGVTDVVQIPEGVAVVATGTWAALRGRRALKTQWDESSSKSLDSDAAVRRAIASRRRSRASRSRKPDAGREPGSQDGRGGLRVPVPRPRRDGADELRRLAARRHARDLERPPVSDLRPQFAAQAAGLPLDKVKLNTLVSGGSFGRRANGWSDYTVAAVNVAKAISGRAPCACSPRARTTARRPVSADVSCTR